MAADRVCPVCFESHPASRPCPPVVTALTEDRPYPENPGATHYDGCWRDRGHHNCAVALLAEQSALLALYSGGRAGTVPEGWLAPPFDTPALARSFLIGGDALVAYVHADGAWRVRDDGPVIHESPGPRPVLTACAEALAWIAGRGGK